jgi:LmbE family N-acetylglucosaminyl deacetylase
MKLDFGRILIVSPHADDWFLGAMKFAITSEVRCLILTDWRDANTQVEQDGAWKALNPAGGYRLCHLTDGKLPEESSKLREILHGEINAFKPDTIITPNGVHQDHEAAWDEVRRTTINQPCALVICYPNLNCTLPLPTFTLHLSEEEAKLKERVFDEVWQSQHWRRQYCQLGEVELYNLVRGSKKW